MKVITPKLVTDLEIEPRPRKERFTGNYRISVDESIPFVAHRSYGSTEIRFDTEIDDLYKENIIAIIKNKYPVRH